MSEMDKKHKNFYGHLLLWGRYLIVLAFIVYVLSGIYRINTSETGILRVFGKVMDDNVESGLHYSLPYPLSRIDKVRIQERKRISVGFEFSDQVVGRGANPFQNEFISGDENVLNLDMVIQYFIISPVEYLLTTDNSEAIIRSYAKTNLTKTIAQMKVDEILRGEGKVFIQTKVLQSTQADLDRIMNGEKWVQITSINLQNVSPPIEVADAFKDVVTARQDRDRLINEAEGYRYDALPKARGKAAEIIQLAEIYRQEKVDQSQGDAERFLKMAQEFKQKGPITSTRLYIETMERVMARINKIFVNEKDDQKPVDLNIIDLKAR